MYKKSIALPYACQRALFKFLLAVKLTALLVFLTLLQANADALAQEVSIHVKNTPLKEVFKSLRQQTGYDFLYLSSDLKRAKPVTLHADNQSLKDVLHQCLVGQPFTFEIKRTTVLIRKTASLPYTILPSHAHQQWNISGNVTNAKGEPLPGVTVTIKNAASATST